MEASRSLSKSISFIYKNNKKSIMQNLIADMQLCEQFKADDVDMDEINLAWQMCDWEHYNELVRKCENHNYMQNMYEVDMKILQEYEENAQYIKDVIFRYVACFPILIVPMIYLICIM